MPIKSPKAKGGAGEREAARLLEGWGREIGVALTVERNLEQTRSGGYDLIGVPKLAVEVKRVQALALPAWWRQTCRAAEASDLIPFLMWRRNRGQWNFRVRINAAHYGTGEEGFGINVIDADLVSAPSVVSSERTCRIAPARIGYRSKQAQGARIC